MDNINSYWYEDLQEIFIADICNNDYMYFLEKPNVVGVAIGYKKIKNLLTKEKCITVFVNKKVPKIMLSSESIIPNKYRNITTDVIQSGDFHEAALTERIRPVVGGYSISNEVSTVSGSLGCLVRDSIDYYILSNNHVIAEGNKAPLNSKIVQPGILDGGKIDKDTIAILSNFIHLKYRRGLFFPSNFVDCAIGKVISKDLVSNIIDIIGAPRGVIIPRLNTRVQKVGRTTELTKGRITNKSATLLVKTVRGIILYKNQILSDVTVLPGDSGSLLLDSNKNAVGLTFSVSTEDYAAHNPIVTVLNNLNVVLVTE